MKKIIVVDDEESVRESCKEELEGNGYSVLLYPNGSALLGARDIDYDLALVDLDLGKGNASGEVVTTYLKTLYPDRPVISMTGNDHKAERADGYLGKVLDLELLISEVARFLPDGEG